MYYVYIARSIPTGRYYIGSTSDLDDRLRHHNSGVNRSTREYRPWKLVYSESFDTKQKAWLREHQLKRYKGGEAFKKLVDKE